MRKHIILSLGAGALLSLGGMLWTGCDDDGGATPGTMKDMAMPAGDQGGSAGGDMTMAKSCVENPTTNEDFLNSCAPDTVVPYEITPKYPSLAPNGVLPDLP